MFRFREGEVEALGERGWFYRDGFLDEETLAAARAHALALPLRAAGISRGAEVDRAVRGDRMTWADERFPLWPRFEALRVAANRDAYLGLERFDVQIARYPGDGSGYARHRDAFRDGLTNARRLTAIVYLHEHWRYEDGGLLRLYPRGASEAVDVKPLGGRLVVFLADEIEHEVLPAFGERLAATAWYHRR